MRLATVLLLIVVTALAGCSRRASGDVANSSVAIHSDVVKEEASRVVAGAPTPSASSGLERNEQELSSLGKGAQQGQQSSQSPRDSADSAQASNQTTNRKIIRNAEITIETDKPEEGQRKIASIADKHGGFVVISESRQNEARAQTVASTVVNVVVRVPAQKFEAAIAEIEGVGGRILHRKESGQDVTEEYIDLEARIRTKRALEAQFLEIMKQARKISEALEVQNQLAEVRTEIERLEGRRRFLENQSALSTINIALHTPVPVVAATTRGFFFDLKAAFGDGVDTGAEIILGVIRFVIVMIPVTLFILLPAWIVFKWLRRRVSWQTRTAPAPATNLNE